MLPEAAEPSPRADFGFHHFLFGPHIHISRPLTLCLCGWILLQADTFPSVVSGSLPVADGVHCCLALVVLRAHHTFIPFSYSTHVWSFYTVLDHGVEDRDTVPTCAPVHNRKCVRMPFEGGSILLVAFYGVDGDMDSFKVPAWHY